MILRTMSVKCREVRFRKYWPGEVKESTAMTQQDLAPNATTPEVMPFVGWSRAAEGFRHVASSFIYDRHTTILLVGPRGVGKRLMGRVLQHVAGLGPDELPIIDIDVEPS